jgi:hypothetical protein
VLLKLFPDLCLSVGSCNDFTKGKQMNAITVPVIFCDCEMWSLYVETSYKMSENKVPMTNYGPKNKDMGGHYVILHIQQLCDLYRKSATVMTAKL